MNNLFDPKLVPEDQRGGQPKRERQLGLSLATTAADAFHHEALSSIHDTPMVGGDSIDDIIRDNSDELSRRRSLPQPFSRPAMQDESNKGVPIMEFRNDSDLQFGGAGDDAAFAAAFSQPGMLPMSEAGDFSPLSPEVMGSMMAFSNLNVGPLSSDTTSMSMFGGSGLETHFPGAANPLDVGAADFTMGINPEAVSLGAAGRGQAAALAMAGEDQEMMNVAPGFAPSPSSASGALQRPQQVGGLASLQPQMPLALNDRGPSGVATAFGSSPISASANSTSPPSTVDPAMAGPIGPVAPPGLPKGKTIYSKSGFNMIRALYYVATRPDASVLLGAVDMSCAFVVCDVTQNDCPIIYVSDNFQNLTGYSSYEIMGKNCRFLQAPDGKVEAGSRRDFVENHAVYRLKRKIAEGKEVQQSLINYRKGGKPFLNLLTMVPIPWDDDLTQIHYFVGFQIDLVESPDAVVSREMGGGVQVNYKHSELPQYIWTPPSSSQWEADNGKTLAKDDVSTLLKQYNPSGGMSDWHKQSWDKMLLENADDVVHVLSLKGMFLYLSPSCKKVLEYDTADLVGNMLSSVCHPSDIVPVTRELKDTQPGNPVNILFRIRRKRSGYTWFESHGSLFVEQGKGRKSIILVGRKRPVFALQRSSLEAHGGIGDSELWTKLSTSGMFLFVSSNVRSLLDLQPENLVGTSIQDLMRKESRAEFGRSIEKARRGKIVTCKHEVQNRRGQVLQAQTLLYPGDTAEGQKPTFLLAQTKLLKASSRILAPAATGTKSGAADDPAAPMPSSASGGASDAGGTGLVLSGQQPPADGGNLARGRDATVAAADDNMFEELKTTRCTSWQYELRQMEKMNRMLAEELGQLLSSKKKRKRRKGVGNVVRDCANCHTRNTPEWRRGPSGQRDLCNSCGLRWAKQTGRVSPRNSSRGGNGDTQSKKSNSPIHSSPLQREVAGDGDGDAAATGDGISSQGAGDHDAAAQGLSQPPQSHLLLAGGSGARGGSMGMASIREERETSA